MDVSKTKVVPDNNDVGSGDSDPKEYLYAQQLVQTYFQMMTVGCENGIDGDDQVRTNSKCTNAYCLSNPNFKPLPPADAAIQSIYFATRKPVPLCIPFVNKCFIPMPKEEHPETDDDPVEDSHVGDYSTPRRRLSDAMELDISLNLQQSRSEIALSEDKRQRCNGRRFSLPKQKLLDAIKNSFPRSSKRQQTSSRQ